MSIDIVCMCSILSLSSDGNGGGEIAGETNGFIENVGGGDGVLSRLLSSKSEIETVAKEFAFGSISCSFVYL